MKMKQFISARYYVSEYHAGLILDVMPDNLIILLDSCLKQESYKEASDALKLYKKNNPGIIFQATKTHTYDG